MEFSQICQILNALNFADFIVANIQDCQIDKSGQVLHLSDTISGQVHLGHTCKSFQTLDLADSIVWQIKEH